MEKDKTTTIITKEAQRIINKNKTKIKADIVYGKDSLNILINNKKDKVTIYDIVYINTKKQIIKVNDHINKTGENPLRGRQSLSAEPFFDITRLYSFLPKGVTTTSWGHSYKTMKNKNQHPSTYMSNLAILCKAVGFKEITGILINNQEG